MIFMWHFIRESDRKSHVFSYCGLCSKSFQIKQLKKDASNFNNLKSHQDTDTIADNSQVKNGFVERTLTVPETGSGLANISPSAICIWSYQQKWENSKQWRYMTNWPHGWRKYFASVCFAVYRVFKMPSKYCVFHRSPEKNFFFTIFFLIEWILPFLLAVHGWTRNNLSTVRSKLTKI